MVEIRIRPLPRLSLFWSIDQIVNGPEVLSKFVGETKKNVRDLFDDAKEDQRARGDQSDLHVIIFDEIDAICKDGDFGTKRPKVDQGERGEVLRDHLVEHKTIGLELHSASTRMDIDTGISNVDLHPRMDEPGIDQLPKEMHEMTIGDNKTIYQKDKEITPTMVNTNKGESGHVISTTIGGRNGQPKQ